MDHHQVSGGGLAEQVVPPDSKDEELVPAPPAAEGWLLLGAHLLSAVYLWVVAWLVLLVLVVVVVLGWTPVVVTSGSMAPAIQSGDVVLLDHGDTADLAPGTVVTLRDPVREQTLLTHRIVAVDADGRYRTRGDANAVADSVPIAADAIVGRGRLLVPLLGLPTVWLRSDPLLLVGWIVATVLAGASVASLSRPLRPRGHGAGS